MPSEAAIDRLVVRLIGLNCFGLLAVNLSALTIYFSLSESGIARTGLTSSATILFIAGSICFLAAWIYLAADSVKGAVNSRSLSYLCLSMQGTFLLLVCFSGFVPANSWDGLTLYFDEAAKLLDVAIGPKEGSEYVYKHRRHGILGTLYAGSWGAVDVKTMITSLGVNLVGLLPVLQLLTLSFALGRLWRLTVNESLVLSTILVAAPLFLSHAYLYGYQESWIQAHVLVVICLQLAAISKMGNLTQGKFFIHVCCPLLIFLPALLLKNLAWLYGAALFAATFLLYLLHFWRAFAPWVMGGMILMALVPLIIGFDVQFTQHPSSRVALIWNEPALASFGGRNEALVFADPVTVLHNFLHAFFVNSSFAGIFVASLVVVLFGLQTPQSAAGKCSLLYLVLVIGVGFFSVNCMQALERFSLTYGAPGNDLGLSRFNIPLTNVMGMFVIFGIANAKHSFQKRLFFKGHASEGLQ